MKINEIKPLYEMAINIEKLDNPGGKPMIIQIRTGTDDGGRSEHPPPHIHVKIGNQIDVPVRIKDAVQIGKGHHGRGQLGRHQYARVVDFINYYGRDELIKIFNIAQQQQDPEPHYLKLKAKRQEEEARRNERLPTVNKNPSKR